MLGENCNEQIDNFTLDFFAELLTRNESIVDFDVNVDLPVHTYLNDTLILWYAIDSNMI